MLLTETTIDPAVFAEATGWESKPEGLCKGSQCVPAPSALTDDGRLDAAAVAEKLGMALLTDDATGTVALGPESGGQSLTTAVVPDLVLEDLDGTPFHLSSLHGRKVLLVAWASW